MNVKTTMVGLFLFFFYQVTLAAQNGWKTLALPPTIDTKQEIKSVPASWLAANEGMTNKVAGITVYDGRPENKASLVYDKEEIREDNKVLILSWTLMPSSAEGIWIGISYSATSIALTKQLSHDVTELRVTYDTSVTVSGLPLIIRVEYK